MYCHNYFIHGKHTLNLQEGKQTGYTKWKHKLEVGDQQAPGIQIIYISVCPCEWKDDHVNDMWRLLIKISYFSCNSQSTITHCDKVLNSGCLEFEHTCLLRIHGGQKHKRKVWSWEGCLGFVETNKIHRGKGSYIFFVRKGVKKIQDKVLNSKPTQWPPTHRDTFRTFRKLTVFS